MTISPADAAVAARSFPRRWRGLFARLAGDDEAADLLRRSGAVELAAEAAGVLASTAGALPALSRPPIAAGGDVLDRLESAAIGLAVAVESVPADDWAGAPIERLGDGIDDAVALLRKAETAIEEARHRITP